MKIEFETLADIAADTTLADSDIVKHPDRPGWSTTVGELRAAQGLSAEQRTNWERELGRRVGATATILSVNDNLGTGTFETTLTGGHTARKPFTFSGTTITTPTFAPSVNAGGRKKGQEATATPAPDPYAKDIAALRAASEHRTPEQTFEAEYKVTRFAALAAEHERLDAHLAAHPSPPRLTTAEVKSYAPPDPYKADLDKLRSGR